MFDQDSLDQHILSDGETSDGGTSVVPLQVQRHEVPRSYAGLEFPPALSATGAGTNNSPRLLCDFFVAGCSRSFDSGETDAMLEHTVEVHLQGIAPPASICRFCEIGFPTTPTMEGADTDYDHKETFRDRIEHMLVDCHRHPGQGPLTDWSVLHHAKKIGAMKTKRYRDTATSNLPFADHPDIYPADFVSPEMERRTMIDNQIHVDGGKDDRDYRRAMKPRSGGHGSGGRRSRMHPPYIHR